MKGQGARDTIPLGFEGGQLQLMQRIPKLRGFKNPFRVSYTPVNIGALDKAERDAVDPAGMVELGLAGKGELVKVLGGGTVSRAIRVEAHAFSKSAAAAITAAGGSVTMVPLPFGHGRPPAQGNALTNR
jgi:large subunit ribosomal protein L15